MGNSLKNILFTCMSVNFSAFLPLAPYHKEHCLEPRHLAGGLLVGRGMRSQEHPGPVRQGVLPLHSPSAKLPDAQHTLGRGNSLMWRCGAQGGCTRQEQRNGHSGGVRRRGQMDTAGPRQDKGLQLVAVYQQNYSSWFCLMFVLGSHNEYGCECAGSWDG